MCVWVCLLVFLFFAPRSYSFALSFHLHLNEWCSEFKFFTISITINSVAMRFIIIYIHVVYIVLNDRCMILRETPAD